MHPIPWRVGLAALATFFVLGVPALAQDKVDVQVAKYDDLTATIKKHKGKVLVIDFWADW